MLGHGSHRSCIKLLKLLNLILDKLLKQPGSAIITRIRKSSGFMMQRIIRGSPSDSSTQMYGGKQPDWNCMTDTRQTMACYVEYNRWQISCFVCSRISYSKGGCIQSLMYFQKDHLDIQFLTYKTVLVFIILIYNLRHQEKRDSGTMYLTKVQNNLLDLSWVPQL